MYSFLEYLLWFYDLDNYSLRYLKPHELLKLRDEYQKYIQQVNQTETISSLTTHSSKKTVFCNHSHS